MKKGWQTQTLGELLAVLRNGVNCKQDRCGSGDKVSRIESISDATFDIERVGYAQLREQDKERFRLQHGDILFSHINSAIHVGKTAVFDSDEEVYHGVNLLLMRPSSEVTSSYLEHSLKFLFQTGYWRGVCKQSVNQASVNQQDISRVRVSFPISLEEQQRIVGLLDEAFASLATAQAHAAQNLQNARALFESHLNAVFTNKGKSWIEQTMGDLIESSLIGLSRSSKEQGSNNQYPYVKMNHITRDNRFEFTEYLKVDATVEDAKRFVLKDGDLLFNTRNSHELVGKSCIYSPSVHGVVLFNNNIMRIRFKPGIDSRMVLAAFSSHSVAEDLEGLKSGTTNVSAIYFKDLRNLRVPMPPTSEQKIIAATLDALAAETQRLQKIYEQKLAALAALKKSLLHQAFNGEL